MLRTEQIATGLSTLVAIFSTAYAILDPNAKLIHTTVVFRHGNRTPISIFPGDLYGATYWREGLGQLTNNGKVTAYELGELIRNRYGEFLGDMYNNTKVKAYSSDTDRTIMSGQLVLSALYPPTGDQIWNYKLPWQPIPVHSISGTVDNILAISEFCPRYQGLLREETGSPRIRNLLKHFNGTIAYIEKQLGRRIAGNSKDDFDLLVAIYELFEIEGDNNLTIPNWGRPIFPQPILTLGLQSLILPIAKVELQRLSSGPLLKNITETMLRVCNGTSERKITLLSAHDHTVVRILAALQLYHPEHIPICGSAVFLDLYRSPNGNCYVSAAYRNTTQQPPYERTMPLCPPPCKLNTFVGSLRYLMQNNWRRECKNMLQTSDAKNDSSLISFYTLIGVILIILVVSIAFIGLCIRRRRGKKFGYEIIGHR